MTQSIYDGIKAIFCIAIGVSLASLIISFLYPPIVYYQKKWKRRMLWADWTDPEVHQKLIGALVSLEGGGR